MTIPFQYNWVVLTPHSIPKYFIYEKDATEYQQQCAAKNIPCFISVIDLGLEKVREMLRTDEGRKQLAASGADIEELEWHIYQHA